MNKPIILIAAAACAAMTASAAPSTADTDFVTKAAQAGMAEVAAGRVAESKGQGMPIKAFGQRMVADHTKAGDELKKIAVQEGMSLPTTPSADQTQAGQKLQGLEGADFDKAYAEQMVKDHVDAVALFRNEASTGSDAKLKTFAQKTLPTLEQHLKMAQALPQDAMSKSH